MNLNREDIVQSAVNVQRWCKEHIKYERFAELGECDCPFNNSKFCALFIGEPPNDWGLEDFLRKRGLKENKIEEQKKKAKL